MKAVIKSGTINGAADLTPGKEYDVIELSIRGAGEGFWIKDDIGQPIFCLHKGCSYLMGGDWTLIEEAKDKGARGFFRRLFGLNK